MVDKLLSPLPPECTSVRDQLRFELTLLCDKAQAVVKDKLLSLKKSDSVRGTGHNRALSARNKGSAARVESRGCGNKLQKSATANSKSKVQGNGDTTGNTGGSCPTTTQKTGGEKNAACLQCGKTGHSKLYALNVFLRHAAARGTLRVSQDGRDMSI